MISPRHRHIIWDWNGTLLDDLDYSIAVMNTLLAPRGLPLLDRTRYHALFDFPVRSYYERLGFDYSRVSFEELSVEFIRGYDARRLTCPLQQRAPEVLAAVQAAGLTQSILSAYRHESLHEIVAHFGLTPHFVRLAGLDNDHAHSKAELGAALVAGIGVAPREILLIGDTLHDFEVAQKLGVDCVLIAAGHHPAERLRQVTDRVFPDLSSWAQAAGLALA
jgi:phosphoglycolate phosphatase